MTTGFDAILNLIEQRIGLGEGVVREPSPTQSAVAMTRYVEGLTDEQLLRGELASLGYEPRVIDRLVLAAQLRRQLELYKDRRDIWRTQLKSGDLTESEFRTLLEDAGVTPDTVALEADRSRSQKPASTVQSVDVTLSALNVGEIVAERPVALPLDLGLSILATQEISAPEGARSLDMGLSILAAALQPAPRVPESITVALVVQSIEEA